MKSIDRYKLNYYERKLGAMTAAELQSLLEGNEDLFKHLGPHDPAASYFARSIQDLKSYLRVRQIEEQEIVLLATLADYQKN